MMNHWGNALVSVARAFILALLCLTLLITAYPINAIAQSNNPIPAQTSPPEAPIDSSQTQAAPKLDNSQELEAFLDSFLPQEMEQDHALGGVVSVVKDGQIFFVKGYGFTDPDRTTPVIADRTLFRVASLSKLFTDTVIAEHGMYVREEPTVYSEAIAILDYGQPVAIAPFRVGEQAPKPETIPGFIWPNSAENWIPVSAPISGYVWTDWLTPC